MFSSTEFVWLILAGLGAYFCYLLFLFAVLLKDGAEGVAKVAKVVRAPRWWIEPIAKALEAWKSSRVKDPTNKLNE